MDSVKNVAILIYDDVEVLDFCGPFEVFSVASRISAEKPFNVYTVAENIWPVKARNNLSINPEYTIIDCPTPDILIVPGGQGSRTEMNNESLIEWIKECEPKAQLVLSVCTGALLLAKAGLLERVSATTHHLSFDLLKEIAHNTEIIENKRFVDNGKIITSGGIAAGIDMSLYVVSKLLGEEHGKKVKEVMEYDWKA